MTDCMQGGAMESHAGTCSVRDARGLKDR